VLDASRTRINLRDSKQVSAFHARVVAMNQAAVRYNASIKTRNSDAAGMAQDINACNVLCANRPYGEADLASQLAPDPGNSLQTPARSSAAFGPKEFH